MTGITTAASTSTNQLTISIPDSLEGIDLPVIVLPAQKAEAEIEFFTKEELAQLSTANLGNPIPDDSEDYSKW